jgi:hypothetical protein
MPDRNPKNDNSKYCFAKPGQVYVVYLPSGGTTNIDLGAAAGTYTIAWYNPRTGGALQNGSLATISGPGVQSLGTPPSDPQEDWVALIRK